VSKGHWISAFKGNILSSSSGVDMDVLNLDNERKYVFLKPWDLITHSCSIMSQNKRTVSYTAAETNLRC